MKSFKQDNAIAILRVSLGIMFIAHGLLKFVVFTLPGTAAFFESFGLPGLLAHVVAYAEVAGGALLILGYGTRVIALALLPVLLGATWVHLGNGWVFSNPNGGWEYPLFLAVATVVIAISGPGAWSLQRAR
jgi:putative oxidoreductase